MPGEDPDLRHAARRRTRPRCVASPATRRRWISRCSAWGLTGMSRRSFPAIQRWKADEDLAVRIEDAPKPPRRRMTLTLPVLARVRPDCRGVPRGKPKPRSSAGRWNLGRPAGGNAILPCTECPRAAGKVERMKKLSLSCPAQRVNCRLGGAAPGRRPPSTSARLSRRQDRSCGTSRARSQSRWIRRSAPASRKHASTWRCTKVSRNTTRSRAKPCPPSPNGGSPTRTTPSSRFICATTRGSRTATRSPRTISSTACAAGSRPRSPRARHIWRITSKAPRRTTKERAAPRTSASRRSTTTR